MILVSFLMTCSVVRRRSTVSWVKRQKKNCSSLTRSNHRRASSECTCRLQNRAIQTLASRKFNVFIDPFAGQVHLWPFGNNQRELHSFGSWALVFQKYARHGCQHQIANGTTFGRRLLLQF